MWRETQIRMVLCGFCGVLIWLGKELRHLLTSAQCGRTCYHLTFPQVCFSFWCNCERCCHYGICLSWYLGQWTSKRKRVINFLVLGSASLSLPLPVRMKEFSAFFLLSGKILFLFLPAALISTKLRKSCSCTSQLRGDKGTLARHKCCADKWAAQERKHGKW